MPRLNTLTRLAAVLLLATMLASSAGAQTGPTKLYLPLAARTLQQLVPAARITGYLGASASVANLVYIATGPGLEVLDVEGETPRLIGSLALPVAATQITALIPAGPILYVVAGIGWVEWLPGNPVILSVDISDPASPRLLGTSPFELDDNDRAGYPFCGAAAGDGWFSLSTNDDLLIFDRSRPAEPRLTIKLEMTSCGLAGYGRYLYRSGAPVLDLSRPEAPVPVGPALPASGPPYSSFAHSFVVVDDTLYILTAVPGQVDGQTCYTNRLQAYSLANPAAPAPAGFVDFHVHDAAGELKRCNSLTLVAAGPGRIALRVPGDNLLIVVDAEDPQHLTATETTIKTALRGKVGD